MQQNYIIFNGFLNVKIAVAVMELKKKVCQNYFKPCGRFRLFLRAVIFAKKILQNMSVSLSKGVKRFALKH